MMKLVASLITLAGASSQFRTLHDHNFEHDSQAFSGQTTGDWVILFNGNNCKKCKDAKEGIITARQYIEEDRPEIQGIVYGECNLDTSTAVRKRFQIKKTPTISIFSRGKIYDYKGKFDGEKLMEWIAGEWKDQDDYRAVPPPPSFAESFMNDFSSTHLAVLGGMVLLSVVCALSLVKTCRPDEKKTA